jgi:hypothetical protein
MREERKEKVAVVRQLERATKRRFERKLRPLPEGAFEKVLLYVKKAFPEETLGVSDTSFWIEIEDKANNFAGSSKEAIFQYYLRGYTHLSLAKTVLSYFQRYKVGIWTGDISKEEKENRVSRLANILYDDFPPRYKKKQKRHAYS